MADLDRPRRRATRWLLLAASSALALALAEAGARAWLWASGRPYGTWRAEREIHDLVEGMTGLLADSSADPSPPPARAGREDPAVLYRLHPYFGFDSAAAGRVERVVEAFARGELEGKTTVLIGGGSVAAGFFNGGVPALEQAIAADPRYAGRAVKTFCMAVPGYKEPQQLMQLAYLFSLGCVPDLVIHLDGLNEVRIARNNQVRGLPPTFPSYGHWTTLTASGVQDDPAALEALVEMRALQERARVVQETARARHYAWSAVLGRLTLSRLYRLRAAWAAAQERHVEALAARSRPARADPVQDGRRREDPVAASVACWIESSLACRDLCAARGVRYVNALQPTLHDPGSKPISPEERARGIGEEGFDESVVQGYPLLREGIAELARRGVEAYDLSRIFQDDPRTLYVDSCHFGREGDLGIARALARAMGLAGSEAGSHK